jgi:hypothetical protein
VWIAALISLIAALLFQFYIQNHMDLEGLYGPGGVKIVAALEEGELQRDNATHLASMLQQAFGLESIEAVQALSTLGVGATAGALALCGGLLFGRHSSLIAGMAGAVFAPTVWTGLLLGPDAAAAGFIWMGIAASWMAMAPSPPGEAPRAWHAWSPLFGIPCIWLLYWGLELKLSALPVIAMLGVAPLLGEGRKKIAGSLAGGSLVLAYFLLADPHLRGLSAGVPGPEAFGDLLAILRDGMGLPMAMLAVLGAFWPGPRRVARIGAFVLCVLAMAVSAEALGEKLRGRYLIAASLPLVLLAAGSLSLFLKKGRQLAGAGVLLVLLMGMDSISFLHGWSALFVEHEAASPTTLPRPPSILMERHGGLPRILHSDHSTIGAKPLRKLVRTAPKEGVAGIPLRDGREFHLRAYAAVMGLPYRILSQGDCCVQDEERASCAERLVEELSANGGRLVLPILRKKSQRVPPKLEQWHRQLLAAAQGTPGWTEDNWWGHLDGAATGGDLPCPGQLRGRRQRLRRR